ncbi:hypothetical protein PO909_018098 [Leuciscus waleckii]
MWTEVINSNNSSLHEEPQDQSLKQIVSQVSSWLPFYSDRNGSASPPPLAETPVNRESGIIPAFLLFCCVLLIVGTKVPQPKSYEPKNPFTRYEPNKLFTSLWDSTL